MKLRIGLGLSLLQLLLFNVYGTTVVCEPEPGSGYPSSPYGYHTTNAVPYQQMWDYWYEVTPSAGEVINSFQVFTGAQYDGDPSVFQKWYQPLGWTYSLSSYDSDAKMYWLVVWTNSGGVGIGETDLLQGIFGFDHPNIGEWNLWATETDDASNHIPELNGYGFQVHVPGMTKTGPTVMYVAPSGSHTYPYTNWTTAARDIQTAIGAGADGTLILVSNATYLVTSSITIRAGLTVRSVNGAASTIVDGCSSTRCFYIAHPDAVLDGFTIRNGYGFDGGGAYVEKGLLRNCVCYGNQASAYGGAVVLSAGRMQNCTISGNSVLDPVDGVGGGLYCTSSSRVENSVVYFNNAAFGADYFNSGTSVVYAYSCASAAMAGPGNSTADPEFVNAVAHDYRLLPGSPCVNSGTNMDWMADACDMDGNARIIGGAVDKGAQEFRTDSLACGFAASLRAGLCPLSVVFTASVAGTNTSVTYYGWDFNNDGTNDAAGLGLMVVTGAYNQCGVYSVALIVSNSVGETANCSRENLIEVGPSNAFVAQAGLHIFPFTNWLTAATNIQAAVDVGTVGTVVWVSNGTYVAISEIRITDGVTVRSVNGPDHTFLEGSGFSIYTGRCVYLNHSNACVEGFTISKGQASYGGGVCISGAGLLKDSVIYSNSGYTGGGIYMSYGGLIQNCSVKDNQASYEGGGIYFDYGGEAENSILSGNSARGYGGGAYFSFGGTLKSCLLRGNFADSGGGVALRYGTGSVQNCTLIENSADYGGGALFESTGGEFIRNSIVYFNSARYEGSNYYGAAETNFAFSCTAPAANGGGNITADPQFVSAAAGNWRLSSGSPCINTGSNSDWMAGATDLFGKSRLIGASVDMGAYEYGPLTCHLAVERSDGIAPLTNVFMSYVSGTNTTITFYGWDFDGDGIFELAGPGLSTVTNIFSTYGRFSVSLTVSNTAGETATLVRSDCVKVGPPTAYVSLHGTHLYPFTNWFGAATNIQSAVDAGVDGTQVLVADGTYRVSTQIVIESGITVKGLNGPSRTVVDGGYPSQTNDRCFYLSHSNAVVDGFTIRGGFTWDNSMGGGGGVRIATNGTVQNCIIRDNKTTCYYATGGGGVYCDRGGWVRNCLIVTNIASYYGGGVYCYRGGTVENCTLIGNAASYGGGGLFGLSGGFVRNSIICSNESYNYDTGDETISYSCIIPAVSGAGNISSNPQFVNYETKDFHLRTNSPCIEAGTNLDWVVGAVDLDGKPRIVGSLVDMGVYESGPLACGLLVNAREGLSSQTPFEFVADTTGTNTTGLYFSWDFNNDGVVDLEGEGLYCVTNLYSGCGQFDVSVTVSNSAGETASVVMPGWIKVGPGLAHVSPGGTHVFPYTNWVTAATNIQDAVNAGVDGTMVLVTNGTYVLYDQIVITNGVAVTSVNGCDLTVIDGNYPTSTNRCVYLGHSNAVVDGFTIQGGWAEHGGGVYISATGTVQNCILRRNSAGDPYPLDGYSSYYDGGAVYCDQGGVVRNTVVRDNSASGTGGGGGICLYYGGLLLNVLVVSNQATVGGGVYFDGVGGFVENCTISGNAAFQGGGIYFGSGGGIRNSVVYYNQADSGSNFFGNGDVSYTCAAPLPSGVGCTSASPEFADRGCADYRLLPGSPCVNAGTNMAWMVEAKDLEGNSRVVGTSVDLGAYEFNPQALTVNFSADPREGITPVQVQFKAFVAGTNTSGLYYLWDFNDDGTWDRQGAGLELVTNEYASCGLFTVSLTVSNAVSEAGSRIKTDFIKVGPEAVYVSTNGASVFPYTNWTGSTRSLQAAVNAGVSGTVVWVTNGFYALTNQVVMDDGVVVRSVNGIAVTTIHGGLPGATNRCFYLNNSHAVVDGFTITGGKAENGGGVYMMSGGLLQNCRIIGNRAYDSERYDSDVTRYGGGVYCAGEGVVRNCEISSNSVEDVSKGLGGGIYCAENSTLQSCTICGNAAGNDGYGGGAYFEGGCVIDNSILFFNEASNGANYYVNGSANFSNVCTRPLPTGSGNIAGGPAMLGPAQGNYQLAQGSPCINTGSNRPWMSGTTDLIGGNRVVGGSVDIGAYELAVNCDFTADIRSGLDPLTVVFTAFETNEISYYYVWDFDNDGSVDMQGLGLRVVTNTYSGLGRHSVSLTISNAAGNADMYAKSDYIKLGPDVAYVSSSGTHLFPYTNWLTAATSILAVVDAAANGSLVMVTDGCYLASRRIELQEAIFVQGVNGASQTIIDAGYPRFTNGCFYLAHTGALVAGFTITGGRAPKGGGVYFATNAEVRECVIQGNMAAGGIEMYGYSSGYGGGLYLETGGLVKNCRIQGNVATGSYAYGGGVYVATNGLMENCTVVGNASGYGGGGYACGGCFRNCLFSRNEALSRGGGLYGEFGRATLENCTIAQNLSRDLGGGVYLNGETLINSIVYFNLASEGSNVYSGSGGIWTYSCTAPGVPGLGNVTNDPYFLDTEHDDYRLAADSPCIDKGTNDLSWMSTAKDIAGNARVLGEGVDIGACEYGPLACVFSASPKEGLSSVQSVFSAVIAGTNVSDVHYAWDFDCNGTVDTEGLGLQVVTNLYSICNLFSVSLAVSNEAGEHAAREMANYIKVAPVNAYVSPAGLHVYPFTNWANAATDIQCAVEAGLDGTIVLVTSGVYQLSRQIAVTQAITITGIDGPQTTIIDGCWAHRCVYLSHTGAVVDGLTITRGTAPMGGGVYIASNSLVRNCVIASNTASGGAGSYGTTYGYGGGVFFDRGGLAQNCIIKENTAQGNNYACGAGVYFNSGGWVQNCVINRNLSWSYGARGGGVYFASGGQIQNSIVYSNGAYNGDNYYGSGAFAYSCSTPLPSGAGNVSLDPQFVDGSNDDFHLATNSPCIDAGSNDTWMVDAVDIEGKPRVINGTVDMGAYESIPMGLDSDNDGMPDWWEWDWGRSLTNMDAMADADDDQFVNLSEYRANTRPLDGESFLGLLMPLTRYMGMGFVVQWQSASNRTYQLERSTNLVIGFSETAAVNIPATPPMNVYTDAAAVLNGPYMYRVRTSP